MSTEYKLDNILIVAKELVENIINNNIRVVFLDGGLGSGKTTLVKAICNHIGVKDNVNSPTFTIMNEYVVDKKSKYYKYIKNIYHIDTYRLESQKEIEILNLHSIIKDDNLVFIE
ncbi:MAG: tRNA (adenosine(37)-N6)-threonylcarbamoyltransferase complex ATPase subunit type 1 TsaE [Cyanobium sp. MAG06]|nr:tRNA (adenosine(37)-N6)-threonylcarbamoyltransferase complex ATPase subunit type 1 TsaE [Cyanobium sp. MAG06]